MIATLHRSAMMLAAISVNVILISCSGESGPKQGTPAFDWAAAKQTFAAGDFMKTADNLDKVVATENEFTARARPWLLVLESGMARANTELADRYETGARNNKSDPNSFRKNVGAYRTQAKQASLHFAEIFAAFAKGKDDTIPLAFGYPTGSAAPPLLLTKIATGIPPTEADVDAAQKQNVARGVLLAASAAAGAADDPAKAQEILKAPDAKVPRAVFVAAMANALFDQSQLFSRQKLDDPEKMKIFCERAQEALKTIPETKDTKALSDKIDKTLKAKS